jgi:hypothetical protein
MENEYKRNGMCNIFLACKPLTGKRMGFFLEEIAIQRENAENYAGNG